MRQLNEEPFDFTPGRNHASDFTPIELMEARLGRVERRVSRISWTLTIAVIVLLWPVVAWLAPELAAALA